MRNWYQLFHLPRLQVRIWGYSAQRSCFGIKRTVTAILFLPVATALRTADTAGVTTSVTHLCWRPDRAGPHPSVCGCGVLLVLLLFSLPLASVRTAWPAGAGAVTFCSGSWVWPCLPQFPHELLFSGGLNLVVGHPSILFLVYSPSHLRLPCMY